MSVIFADTQEKVTEAYELLKGSELISIDLETSGLDTFSGQIWSLQVSDGKTSVLIPVNAGISIGEFAGMLADDAYLKLAHNMKFETAWIKHHWGIDINGIFCTQVCEKVITAGLAKDADLASTLKRRLDIEVSKDERKDFYDGTFEAAHNTNPLSAWTPALINYGIIDVLHLPKLYAVQIAKVIEYQLEDTIELEMAVLPEVARMELRGVFLNVDGAKEYGQRMKARADEIKPKLEAELEANWQAYWRREYAKKMKKWNSWDRVWQQLKAAGPALTAERDEAIRQTKEKYGRITKLDTTAKSQRDAEVESIKREYDSKKAALKSRQDKHKELKPFTSKPAEAGPINMNARQQVQAALAETGCILEDMTKQTLEDNAGAHPLLDLLLDYNKFEKLAQFGELYTHVNPVTQRIHANFDQCKSTGRFGCSKPNLQNVPARTEEGKEIRSLFVAPAADRRMISADYSAMELLVLAILSGDETLLEAVNLMNAGGDMHCFTMAKVTQSDCDSLIAVRKGDATGEQYKEVYRARKYWESICDIKDLTALDWGKEGLTKWVNKLRDNIKTLVYMVAYGASPYGVSKKLRIEADAAGVLIDLLLGQAYRKAGDFLKSTGEDGLQYGYTTTVLGRRRFYNKPKPVNPDYIQRKLKEWAEVNEVSLASMTNDERGEEYRRIAAELKKEFNSRRNAIKRQAANAPIQGLNADATKRAIVLFGERSRELGWPEEDGLVSSIHDELLAEVHKSRAEQAAELLRQCMVDGAQEFLGRDVQVKVAPEVATYWKH